MQAKHKRQAAADENLKTKFPQGLRQQTASRLCKLLPFASGILLFAFAASAHEPITTKVRVNKEVIRIFERSCLSCHRPNGIAPMSLAPYEEARPWAKAIKEEMLEKRMPVWHPIKGFAEFRNTP